jgi:Mg-chelatase subunit ChlD
VTDRSGRADDRGVSDVVGYVLLIGVVTAGIASVLLLGGAAVSDIKGDAAATGADTSLGQADRRLVALSGTRVNTTQFQLRGVNPGQVRVLPTGESGRMNVSVSGGACSVSLPLSTVVYERDDGSSVAVQGGGRFAVAPDGDSSVVTAPPSFTARNGSIAVTTYNLTGFIDDRTVTVRKNATESERVSATVDAALVNGSACQRPTGVSIVVTSQYYDAWADYLESETGVSASTNPSNRTARVDLPQSWLPRRANDSANQVINLSDASMTSVTSDGGPASAPSYTSSTTTDEITVGKGVNNTYRTVAVPLGNGTQSSFIEQVSGNTVYRRPIDVVFVMDESGSMGGCADGTGGTTTTCPDQSKIDAARDAAKNFTEQINSSTDRVGFVGFTTESRYLETAGTNNYLTGDRGRANTTIEEYDDGGGTDISTGLRRGNAMHDFRADTGSQKVIILLGDGKNSVSGVDNDKLDEDTVDQAERAAENNVTIYTIGFGGGADEELLKDVANETGGQYRFASDAAELDAVFQDILTDITSTQAIVHRPTTAQLTVGSRTVSPQLGYDNPDVNQINGSYDINDPEYRGGFEFSAAADDGNLINVSAVSYDCEPGALELTDRSVFNATNNRTYRRVRCTDVNESTRQQVPPTSASIYLDGASAASLPDDEAWYQSDLRNETLDGYLSGGQFDLESNEAVVVFDYTVSGQTSRIVMLYQIGLSESGTTVDIFDVRVVRASVGD